MFFIGIMLMEAVKALGAAGPEFAGTALNAFGHVILLTLVIGTSTGLR
jgi:hypothetical protein